jgi:hypothetical protein
MDDDEAKEACNIVDAAINAATDLIEQVEDLRQFVQPVNINALRNWGRHGGCPTPVHFAPHFQRIAFGKHEDRCESVDVPPVISAPIPRLDFWTPREKARRRRAPANSPLRAIDPTSRALSPRPPPPA